MTRTTSPPTERLEFAARSDVGEVRVVNQDAVYVGLTPNGALALVADGMGGHQSGEVASQRARDTLVQALARPQPRLPSTLARAVQRANLDLHAYASANPESFGMGTTLTFVLLDDPVALVGHVGDSRAYLIREGTITQLTRDHSWVADRLRQGLLSPEEARRHGWRNVLTNALGPNLTFTFELSHVHVRAGDRLLVCSDGLSGVLGDAALLEAATKHPAEAAVAALIDRAKARGSPDNITAALLVVGSAEPKPKRYTLPKERTLSVTLGAGPEYLYAIEDAFGEGGPLARMRRQAWWPLRFWLLGCAVLVMLFVVFTLYF
jgi:serine/threonine protein phosphatase PrpC